MNAELEAIKDAADKTTEEGRDLPLAVSLSDAYVDAHPEQFTDYEDMTMTQCVEAIDVFRAANMDESEWRTQVWIFHKWDFQDIGGNPAPRVRVPA